ncbi:MAG: DUF3037 domain-containing protein [Thermomicrobiales bacterium]|nr:DUF3037 domain-containing protein [Thermomicrobiales bacterium]
MHESAARTPTSPVSPTGWYSYAVVRIVPRIDRGECINVGIILFAREQGFLDARIALDAERLQLLDPGVDLELVERHLATFQAIARGDTTAGGSMAEWPPSERFHWLTAPRSTIIQTSPVHIGATDDPAGSIEMLLDTLVRRPVPN